MELIEAQLLFDVDYDRIEVVVHPQSVIHSMVEFYDGATLAQASPPDMRLPIALALGWPDRVPDAAAPLDWTQAQQWTFEPVDNDAFPAIELARAKPARPAAAPRPSTPRPTRNWWTPSTTDGVHSWPSSTGRRPCWQQWLARASRTSLATSTMCEASQQWAREAAGRWLADPVTAVNQPGKSRPGSRCRHN